jgi:transcription termination factor NusB
MWTNDLRNLTVTIFYQILFWDVDYSACQEKNWLIDLNISPEQIQNSNLDQQLISSIIRIFFENKDSYTSRLQTQLKDWSKTYNLIKAILFSYLVELEFCQKIQKTEENNQGDNYISQYIKITQTLVGGANVGLVHAVLVGIEK